MRNAESSNLKMKKKKERRARQRERLREIKPNRTARIGFLAGGPVPSRERPSRKILFTLARVGTV